jgi:hypothetical protein
MPSVFTLNDIRKNVVLLSGMVLSGILLNVVLLSGMVPASTTTRSKQSKLSGNLK